MDSDKGKNQVVTPVQSAPSGAPAQGGQAAQGAQHQNCEKRKRKIPITSWIEAVASILLIVITGTYTYYARGQWFEMIRAANASRDSADAAKSAAETAHDSLISSGGQFKIGARPYLVAVSATPDSLGFPVGTRVKVKLLVHNFGRTPALKARLVSRVSSEPKQARLNVGGSCSDSNFTVGGDSDFTPPVCNITVYEKGAGWIKIGDDAYLIFNGELEYYDVFKERHTTKFCFDYAAYSGIEGFIHCDKGNEVD